MLIKRRFSAETILSVLTGMDPAGKSEWVELVKFLVPMAWEVPERWKLFSEIKPWPDAPELTATGVHFGPFNFYESLESARKVAAVSLLHQLPASVLESLIQFMFSDMSERVANFDGFVNYLEEEPTMQGFEVSGLKENPNQLVLLQD